MSSFDMMDKEYRKEENKQGLREIVPPPRAH